MPALTASSQPATCRIVQPCDLGDVRATAQSIRDFLAGRGVEANVAGDLELVLVEACNNAIEHAPASAQTLPLTVECLCDGRVVELRVHDHTAGFEWPAQTVLPTAESEGGRGLFLMTTLVDEVDYFRSRKGNLLVLRKKLPAEAVPQPDPAWTGLLEELSSCYESLAAIFRYRAVRTDPGELQAFAEHLFADLVQIISADWFVLRLHEEHGAGLKVFAASPGLGQLSALSLDTSQTVRTSVELAAVASRRDVWFDDACPLRGNDPLAVSAGDHGLVHPIFAGEQLLGTLAVGRKMATAAAHSRRVAFTASHANVVGTFTEFFASQVLNARMQEEQVNRRLFEHELALARSIQESLLPRELPHVSGVKLAGSCQSARQVGGDFYDVLRVGENQLLLVVADVMGKGIPAAMFAAILRTLVRATPELASDPAELLGRINRLLFDDLSAVDMFITTQLVHFDAGSGQLTVASAGHCPLLVATLEDSPFREISPQGMPLGVARDATYGRETVTLRSRAGLLIYTDGLSDLADAHGEPFGSERLGQLLVAALREKCSAEALKRSLTETLARFQPNPILKDDQTFLIMTWQNS